MFFYGVGVAVMGWAYVLIDSIRSELLTSFHGETSQMGMDTKLTTGKAGDIMESMLKKPAGLDTARMPDYGDTV